LKAIIYQLYPSIIAWIPYDDLWEFVNTTIEPMTMNRLPHLFKVEIGNWVKTGVVAGSKYTWTTVQVMKLLLMQFSTRSSLHPSWSKYSQQPVLKTTSVYVSPLMSETKFHTHTELQTKL
jgi:hypothetical protein